MVASSRAAGVCSVGCGHWGVAGGFVPGQPQRAPCCWAIVVMRAPPVAPRGEENGEGPQMEADGPSSRAMCEGPVHPLLGFRAV